MKIITTGWRRASLVNTGLTIAFSILATIFLGISISKAGGIQKTNFIFFKGSCNKSRSINLWLHLALNIFSTGVLASSNFFMQVLGSPSRKEVDRAHRERKYLSIGLSGLRNLSGISGRKACLFVLFAATSFPFHFFFNSTVFSTKHISSDWHLTIASEGFVNGPEHSGPGAVLWAGGDPSYGSEVNVMDYFTGDSAITRNVSYAAKSGHKWKRLEVPQCLSEYSYCAGRSALRNVIWVVRSHDGGLMDGANGWNSSKILKMDELSQEQRNNWQKRISYQEQNSLWFAANCSSKPHYGERGYKVDGCTQSCGRATGNDMGLEYYPVKSPKSIQPTFSYDFFSGLDGFPANERENRYQDSNLVWPGLSDRSAGTLELQYCLAEEVPETCKVAVSNTLLLVVVICLWIKTLLCITVLFFVSHEKNLVVPGDAIASFICSPDDQTVGRCTSDFITCQPQFAPRQTMAPAKPVRWQTLRQSWRSTIYTHVWGVVYTFFTLDIIFVVVMFALAQKTTPIQSPTTHNLFDPMANPLFNPDGDSADNLLHSVLIANFPQLILSVSYFLYNGLFTRLCVEKEWKSYSMDYKPLRVTDPKGDQQSTYWLQLPYKYSVPLISISVILHWIVSNCLYVFVYEGGFMTFKPAYFFEKPKPWSAQSGLDQDAYVGVGYSTFMLLILLILIVILIPLPLLWASRKARGQMPNGGSNTLVIAAACHVPLVEAAPVTDSECHDAGSSAETSYQMVPVSDVDQSRSSQRDEEAVTQTMEGAMALLEDNATHDYGRDKGSEYLTKVSEGPIRWGEVKTGILFEEQEADSEACGHLSFGSKDHDVKVPMEGKFYY